ncbi:hypothetical protein V8D89_002936 [Ganoderma adspersum]
MSSTRLNLDVLATACEFLADVPDILSFALTCSVLRPVANTWLLSMKPIYLADAVSVGPFHAFLFSDAPARAQHVRALDILNPWPRDGPLRPTLPGDSSLLYGSRSRCTDDPRIIDAIVGIQNLRSLSIHGWSLSALSLLGKLGIWFSNNQVDFWSPAGLEKFLPRHLAPSVEKLEIGYCITDLSDTEIQANPRIMSSSRPYLSMSTYPLVRSLHVGFHLQHFFPALDGTLSLGLLDDSISVEAYADLRTANQRVQEGEQDRLRMWKKLDRVVCDLRMLYVLGLRCPIHLVMLDYCSPLTSWCAAPALRDNPVPRLKMSFRLSEGRDVLEGIFSPELARILTHLTLLLEFANDGRPRSDADPETVAHLQWDDVLKSIISRLHPLHNLTHLRLVHIAYSEEFVRATRGSVFDCAGTAAQLARPLPSLRYVFHVAQAWRVAPLGSDSARLGEGEPALVELHEDVAETIIRNEKLVLSEADKVTLHLDEYIY